MNRIGDAIKRFTENINNSKFNNDFLNANTIVSNFAFLILVVFIFVLVSAIGMNLVSYYLSPSETPKILKGMVSGAQCTTIKQNPNTSGSVPIKRSYNEHEGVEFTWSLWLFLEGGPSGSDSASRYNHIFHKGDNMISNTTIKEVTGPFEGMNKIQNAPGLYIKPFDTASSVNNASTTLTFVMNTFDTSRIIESVDIDNIPVNKWFNIMIMLKNRFLDVYINGSIKERKLLLGMPKQNYGDIHIGNCSGESGDGFDGYLSNLSYYNYALGTREIEGVMTSGANTTLIGGDSINASTRNNYFLSLKWFVPE